jgi:predicted transcriptional regulator
MGHTTTEQTQVATRIDGDLLRRLDERCQQERRPRAFVLSEALEKHLAEDRTVSEVAA